MLLQYCKKIMVIQIKLLVFVVNYLFIYLLFTIIFATSYNLSASYMRASIR